VDYFGGALILAIRRRKTENPEIRKWTREMRTPLLILPLFCELAYFSFFALFNDCGMPFMPCRP
jgi:hypothetical protein